MPTPPTGEPRCAIRRVDCHDWTMSDPPSTADGAGPRAAPDEPATNGSEPPTPPAIDPSSIRDPLPQPLFSLRRLGIVALLPVAVALVVVAARSAGDPEDRGAEDSIPIVRYEPPPGGRALRQARVGVELEQGYDGRLIIDGIEIPEEQMAGAIDPDSAEFQRLPDDQRELGPRPNNKNLVMFVPGPGKAITEHDTGEVLMIAGNRQINEEVLKHIAISRDWLKNYQIRVALANNPKTPLPEALKQVQFLKERELAQLAKSKSVPRALVVVAAQRLKQVKR